MIEQLKELLEMQRKYDETVMNKYGYVYDDVIAEKNKTSLIVELGEMMNEYQSKFKYWRECPHDCREKALEEYVDALHFMLSLFNYYSEKEEFIIDEEFHNYNNFSEENDELFECGNLYVVKEINRLLFFIFYENSTEWGISYLFKLGNLLGFKWEEIYNAYKKKNAVNYERLKNGY